MVITATPSNSTLHHLQTLNSQNNKNNLIRDASFSSYLNNKEDIFAGSNHRKDPLHHGVKKEEDEEIGVFEAKKYFHGGEIGSPRVAIIDASKYQQQQKKEETKQETRRYKVQYGTPSVRSESSLNSQSALLQSAVKNSSRNSKSKVQRKSFLAGLGCKCYCSDKNSVDISDHAGEISFEKAPTCGAVHEKRTSKNLINTDVDSNHSAKVAKPHAAELFIKKDVYFQKPEKLGVGILNRENGLAFSTVNSSSGIQPVKVQLQQEEKPRKSLEVFGSPILDNMSKSMSFDRRLSLPSWQSAKSGANFDDDDAASDASSDLFEIDSFTGKSNPFLGKSTSNIASGCASPTTCYAPSEASIAWSVVTASAVEFSAMSDFDDQRSIATISSPIRTSSSNAKPKAGKEIQRRHSSSLLGCKSQKAVGVAVDAFTTSEKPGSTPQIRRKSEMFPHVTKLQGGAKVENFGAKHVQHAYAKRTPSPHAPSQLLYI